MVRIEPGRFQMGTAAADVGFENDELQHWVVISRPFLISRTEITQGQWRSVMGDGTGRFRDCGSNCPAEGVGWDEAIQFCNRLSEIQGLGRCYSQSAGGVVWDRSCAGYRLATEAEWEYAARGGSATDFASGPMGELECGLDENLDAIGWYCGNSGGAIHPAARKRPNAWGLYDMHGNVWEWVWDRYGAYPEGKSRDPLGASDGQYRVNRGGAYDRIARRCRSANRNYSLPDGRDGLGLRVVRSIF